MTQKKIDAILDEPFWPPNLETGVRYETTHDDNDGEPKSGTLAIVFTKDGDAWVEACREGFPIGCLRFRMPVFGGGRFPKIRTALLLLGEAIRQEGIVE